jgi:SAM-dependent methyltransferase
VEPDWNARRTSFGGAAEHYHRFRPDYPAEALRWALGTDPLMVLDLGAGTGRLGAVVHALGHEVVAVEPDPGMRAVAELELPGRVREGSAEAIPEVDGAVDAVVVGQAFHWFDRPRALPEISRVLRHPGGVLALFWNVRDDRSGWLADLSAITRGEDGISRWPKAPDYDVGPWFEPLEAASFPHAQELDADSLLGLVGSWSKVALHPDRDQILAEVAELARTHPDLAGRDRFTLPYVTKVYRTVVA